MARWSALPPMWTDSQRDLGLPAMLGDNELDKTPQEGRDAFTTALHTHIHTFMNTFPSTTTCTFMQTPVHIHAFTHIRVHTH